MEIVTELLDKYFPKAQWRISTPTRGMQKEAYVAESDTHKLFIKYDTDIRAWPRLSEIGATPEVVAVGVQKQRPYLIQKYVDGSLPTPTWFAQNAAQVGRFIQRYQNDPVLASLLAPPGHSQTQAQHIQQEIAAIEQAIGQSQLEIFRSDQLLASFQRFQEQRKALTLAPFVPIHTDPSNTNMLVTITGITFLDWDEIVLSHPMRDVGLILWWYVHPSKWQDFYAGYGPRPSEEDIFWWVAKRSLELSLWFDKHSRPKMAAAFLNDFNLALGHEENPQVQGTS